MSQSWGRKAHSVRPNSTPQIPLSYLLFSFAACISCFVQCILFCQNRITKLKTKSSSINYMSKKPQHLHGYTNHWMLFICSVWPVIKSSILPRSSSTGNHFAECSIPKIWLIWDHIYLLCHGKSQQGERGCSLGPYSKCTPPCLPQAHQPTWLITANFILAPKWLGLLTFEVRSLKSSLKISLGNNLKFI